MPVHLTGMQLLTQTEISPIAIRHSNGIKHLGNTAAALAIQAVFW